MLNPNRFIKLKESINYLVVMYRFFPRRGKKWVLDIESARSAQGSRKHLRFGEEETQRSKRRILAYSQNRSKAKFAATTQWQLQKSKKQQSCANHIFRTALFCHNFLLLCNNFNFNKCALRQCFYRNA